MKKSSIKKSKSFNNNSFNSKINQVSVYIKEKTLENCKTSREVNKYYGTNVY